MKGSDLAQYGTDIKEQKELLNKYLLWVNSLSPNEIDFFSTI